MSAPWGGSKHEALAFPACLLALEEGEIEGQKQASERPRQRKNKRVLLPTFVGTGEGGTAPHCHP